MIVFVLMAVKILASVFQFSDFSLGSFSAVSVLMLFVWVTDDFGESLLNFKSAFWFIMFCGYLLVWVIVPWLTISSRRWLATVGLSCAIGLNIFDIVCCILSALPIVGKVFCLLFSALIIILSLIAIRKM